MFAATAPLRAGDAPVRWVGEEGLHVTMKFLGDVDEALARPIGDSLVTAVRGVKAFDVTLGGGGMFPGATDPHVFWIGVEKHPALELLAHDVERAVGPMGFVPELRPFQPHITIGRARRDALPSALAPLAEQIRSVEYSGVMVVGSVDLMESRPGGRGPSYRTVSRALLGGGA